MLQYSEHPTVFKRLGFNFDLQESTCETGFFLAQRWSSAHISQSLCPRWKNIFQWSKKTAGTEVSTNSWGMNKH